jgi:hypothetical protein
MSSSPIQAFRVPIYGGEVRLPTSRESFLADRARIIGSPLQKALADGCTAMLQHPSGAVTYLVGHFDGRVSTLSHELTHAALFILQRAGIDPADSSGETLASLQGELMMLCGADLGVVPR